jgi:hypothetical protein
VTSRAPARGASRPSSNSSDRSAVPTLRDEGCSCVAKRPSGAPVAEAPFLRDAARVQGPRGEGREGTGGTTCGRDSCGLSRFQAPSQTVWLVRALPPRSLQAGRAVADTGCAPNAGACARPWRPLAHPAASNFWARTPQPPALAPATVLTCAFASRRRPCLLPSRGVAVYQRRCVRAPAISQCAAHRREAACERTRAGVLTHAGRRVLAHPGRRAAGELRGVRAAQRRCAVV